MRVPVLLVAVGALASAPAVHAEPPDDEPAPPAPTVEASAFAGVDRFGSRSELGNSSAPDQVPGTSALVGLRAGWIAIPARAAAPGGRGGFGLALEAELAFAPAFTGDAPASGRPSYFAPVFEWRAHARLRLPGWRRVAPHVVLGGGGVTVLSSSPFMARETDPVGYWGPGVTVPAFGRWHVRLDLRHGVMPARGGGATSTFAASLGLGTAFELGAGGAPATERRPAERHPAVAAAGDAVATAPTAPADGDADGVPDRIDRCPAEPETANGVVDDDGCPELDPDSDGLAGAADRCPDQAEDIDRFEDADGCPDPDNDRDALDDVRDTCPIEPETRNGVLDDDGCPDAVPADLTAALTAAVTFEPGRARVTPRARAALAALLTALRRHPSAQIAITGHPERGDDDLARRRAEAVKWDLVDQGIAEDRIATRIAPPPPRPRAPAVTFELAAAAPP